MGELLTATCCSICEFLRLRAKKTIYLQQMR